MSQDGRKFNIQLDAGADLRGLQYYAIDVDGDISANNGAIGILQNKPNSGEDASICFLGNAKAKAGGTITAGARVRVTTSGFFVACGSNEFGVGKALEAVGSGGVFEGLFNFINGPTSVVSAHLT